MQPLRIDSALFQSLPFLAEHAAGQQMSSTDHGEHAASPLAVVGISSKLNSRIVIVFFIWTVVTEGMTNRRITRPTRRPTVAIEAVGPKRIQEVIIGIFKRYDFMPMDLELLVYFTLQSFEVSPAHFESMQRAVRTHIMANFAIHQGAHIRLTDLNMRRITVCYTIERQEE